MQLDTACCASGDAVISKQCNAATTLTATFLLSADEHRPTTTVMSILSRNLQTEFKERFYVTTRYIVAMPRQLYCTNWPKIEIRLLTAALDDLI